MSKFQIACFAFMILGLVPSGPADCRAAAPKAKGDDKAEKPALKAQQKREVLKWLDEFSKAESTQQRGELCRKIITAGPAAAELFRPVLDEQLGANFKQYAQLFAKSMRAMYMERLSSLTDAQTLQVQKVRRLWQHYVLHGGGHHDFKNQFLKPCWDVAEFLVIKPEEIKDPAVAAQRLKVVELIDYQTACRTAMGLEPDPDPTTTKVSPTGIEYPHLDEPPTRKFYLSFFERTLALATMGPKGAQKVLLMNLDSAREIDVQESEFTMYSNTVRMIVGSVAWYVHPLICAVTRDHSADRKAGLASGHMSNVPGKRGFTHRLKRMGAPFCGSEGAGGGRDGRGYIYGLSYGGGHTGPLYRLARNVVGVGRRGGVYTSNYRTDGGLMHPCAATLGELFMPPGIGRGDVKTSALNAIYNCLYTRDYGRAQKLIATTKLTDDFDTMLLKFFSAAVTAELDWYHEGIAAVEATGDVFETKRRLEWARKTFAGIESFEEKAAPMVEKLCVKRNIPKELAQDLKAGTPFRTIARGIISGKFNQATGKRLLGQLIERYPDTVYAQAAQAALDKEAADTANEQGLDPIVYFTAKGDGDLLHKHMYYRD